MLIPSPSPTKKGLSDLGLEIAEQSLNQGRVVSAFCNNEWKCTGIPLRGMVPCELSRIEPRFCVLLAM